ncbi:Mediator of RNA polymerase II transcription subunit 4-like protein [Elsinoe fawcettii]|nr:Mediator of RNA polymerase II transcription subunit 4-like protein [Elsinoe fawcettii]
MLSILQTRYQRVERALDTLLESVTAYNPSLAAADELVAADDSVNEALEELATHHSNYGRILTLRATSDSLDAQIKTTIRTLAEARKTLQSITLPPSSLTTSTIPSAPTSDVPRPVRVDELLSYAKFISKTTVPPTRTPLPQPDDAPPPASSQDTQPNGLAPQPGQAGPHIKTEPATPDPSALPSSAPTPAPTAPGAPEPQNETLKRVLPPIEKGVFYPWPMHELIAQGGLGTVQAMVERGEDPGAVVLSAEEQAKKDEEERIEKERREEEERRRREEEGRRRRERYEALRAEGGQAGGREEDVFDPDEM